MTLFADPVVCCIHTCIIGGVNNNKMSKECKQNCKLECIKDHSISLIFGKSAGRKWTYSTHKYCSICEYWVSLNDQRFSKEMNCFCCGNKYRNRKKVTEGNRTRRNNKHLERFKLAFYNYVKCLQKDDPPSLLLEIYNK